VLAIRHAAGVYDSAVLANCLSGGVCCLTTEQGLMAGSHGALLSRMRDTMATLGLVMAVLVATFLGRRIEPDG
jgi:hypothetical protein